MEEWKQILIGLGMCVVLGLVLFAGFFAFGPGAAKPIQSQHLVLFSPIISASLDKVPAQNLKVHQFCVSTLPNTEYASEQFCTDFRNVHVYADGSRIDVGTFARIDHHVSRWDYGYGLGSLMASDFTDFITVYVRTEKQREQYQDEMNRYYRRLYAPRDVALITPGNQEDPRINNGK